MHHIQAIIGSPSVVARAREHGLNCAPIPLDAGLAWVPVLAEDLDRLAETSPLAKSDREDAFELFGGVLPAMLRELSMHGPVAYIETEYFGGLGDQVATAFDQGARVVDRGSVNEALRAIGVRARPGLDEWDTVGLANHRSVPNR